MAVCGLDFNGNGLGGPRQDSLRRLHDERRHVDPLVWLALATHLAEVQLTVSRAPIVGHPNELRPVVRNKKDRGLATVLLQFAQKQGRRHVLIAHDAGPEHVERRMAGGKHEPLDRSVRTLVYRAMKESRLVLNTKSQV